MGLSPGALGLNYENQMVSWFDRFTIPESEQVKIILTSDRLVNTGQCRPVWLVFIPLL